MLFFYRKFIIIWLWGVIFSGLIECWCQSITQTINLKVLSFSSSFYYISQQATETKESFYVWPWTHLWLCGEKKNASKTMVIHREHSSQLYRIWNNLWLSAPRAHLTCCCSDSWWRVGLTNYHLNDWSHWQ